MSYFNRVFAARFLKTLLVICCIGLLIAAIWFLGPFFGFGDSRPMQSVESRIIFILLAVLCLVCLWLRWPLFIAVTATLCVLVWILGPFVLVGENYPMMPVNVRLTIISILLIGALFYGLWRLLIALKDNPALLDKLARSKAPVNEQDTSEVAAAIASAVDYVNKKRSNLTFFQRIILARKPQDRFPWYMILGTEGAGKTSAILGSGQDFPVPEQLEQVGKPAPQTRNCECWFANDAIYVDTSGKYVSDPETSQPEWRAILKALKKHRPVKALNGVVISFSAADMLGRSQAELFELAAALRARTDELRQTLGVRFPIYILVTKLDQLPGFAEYFRILTEQEREQVWGVTFPYGDASAVSLSELHDHIKEEFSLLEKRIERDMIVRQQEEYDNRDRKKMYGMPQDFHLLSERVAEVAHNIVFASRYDESQNYTLLRGIYFSSCHQSVGFSLQNNQTLIRKWSNYVENKMPTELASLTTQPEEHDFLINDVSYGRQYFLRQLFSDVILKDKGLARHNLANESKYRLQRFLGHVFCILLAVVFLNGFYNSYRHNSVYLDVVDKKVEKLNLELNRFVKTSADNLLPRLLTFSQYLPEYGSLDLYNPPLDWRFGLYTGGNVVEASGSLYQYFLQRLLLPQIENQATLALQNAIDSGKSGRIYRELKLYLQVYGEGKFDKKYMIAAITSLWETTGKLQPYQERRIFVSHLNTLFDSPEWRRYGQPLDNNLVKYARAMLEREDLVSRLYQRIKDAAKQDAPADLTLNIMAKSRGGELFAPIDENGITVIPGLFTRSGYYDAFKKKMEMGLIWLEREDGWVLGKSSAGNGSASRQQIKMSESGALVNPVQQQILALYLEEYAQLWQSFLSNIRIETDSFQLNYGNASMAADIYMLRTLSASDSPLANLIARAVSETTLAKKENKSLLDNLNNKGQILNAVEKVNLAYSAMEKRLLNEYVDSHFATLREFVTGGRDSDAVTSTVAVGSDLNKLMNALSEQYTLFVIYEDALKNGSAMALSSSSQQLSAESLTWPDPLPNLIAPLLEGAWQRANEEAIARSVKDINEGLGRVCKATLQGRYPFANSRTDVKLADFNRFFSSGGLVDKYFSANLANKVDTASRPWRYKGDVQDSDGILRMFEQAAEIRRIFFNEGEGKNIALNFNVSVPYLDPAITQLNMNFDGIQVNYAHWPVSPVPVMWPASRLNSRITIDATPRISATGASKMFTGPWSLFRWMESAKDIVAAHSEEMSLIFDLDSRRADISVSGLTYNNRPIIELLRNFQCPGED
ncbi:MAG: type VI secretion system membrane subunit TssM [Pantoea sp.]|uniref:type VI secretion system membrane subunit TssM n=2 Tax=Pantoea TaxID=53335 RepID=UPI002906BCCB|nr:type VI secretion system membrane subunit TssM [Pantoea sp.]MDU5783147.1 type VI secretion system membrane subunit TssM [Pantoea sp.]